MVCGSVGTDAGHRNAGILAVEASIYLTCDPELTSEIQKTWTENSGGKDKASVCEQDEKARQKKGATIR